MINRDLEIAKGSDYVLKFEFLGENNLPYVFDEELDSLMINFSDIEKKIEDSIDIDLVDIENPVSVKIAADVLESFTSNPIRYELILQKEDIDLVLLTGRITVI